ncbi:hypothetical protein GGP41_008189 [Bipolaris sorokiniana]|uniref:Uncharacterized protein n=1 Tax=Cochliobolus sativus TaxID=45130 RepID=A0A8H6DYM0_COCSA|nr:hypothetical protein GGP41_008189 [Bipolaris sorokiniana]
MSHNTSCEKRKNGRVALRSKAEDIFSRERKRPRKSPPCYANPYVLPAVRQCAAYPCREDF